MIESIHHLVTSVISPFAPILARLAVRENSLERSERLGLPGGTFPPKPIWMHAASAGETEGAEPIVTEIGNRRPERGIVLSSMTRSGKKRAEKIAAVRSIYIPVDLPGPVRRALDRIDPAAILLVETEIWPALLREASRRGIPVAIVNGRLSAGAFRRMGWAASLYRKCIGSLTLCGVQREVDADRFRHFGAPPDRIHVHGNCKIDALPDAAPEPPFARRDGEQWVVFGSVRPAEEEAVREAAGRILEEQGSARVVIAPRHPERAGPMPDGPAGVRWHRWSDRPAEGGARGIWVDTVGDLVSFYALADVAFVGGSLSRHGGHNPAEPARFGVPTLFGPHIENSREFAEMLLEGEGGAIVRNATEIADMVLHLLRDEAARRRRGKAAREAIEARRGATRLCVDLLEKAGLLGGEGDAP